MLDWLDGSGDRVEFASGDVVVLGAGMDAVPGMELWRRLVRADVPGARLWLGVYGGDVGLVRACFPGSESDSVLEVVGDLPGEVLDGVRYAVAWRVGSGLVFWGPPTEDAWDEFVSGG